MPKGIFSSYRLRVNPVEGNKRAFLVVGNRTRMATFKFWLLHEHLWRRKNADERVSKITAGSPICETDVCSRYDFVSEMTGPKDFLKVIVRGRVVEHEKRSSSFLVPVHSTTS
jgi:hypothetical protein